jgi:hypothetical protein
MFNLTEKPLCFLPSAVESVCGLPEFVQRHFFGNQVGGAGLNLLASRGTHTFHFLAQGLHSSSLQFPAEGPNAKD